MRRKLIVKNSALMVIDVINSCCDTKCEPKGLRVSFSRIRKMVPRLNRFISWYRQQGGKIIFITCVPWQKGKVAPNIDELYKDPHCRYYSNDKTGFSERFYIVRPDDGDYVITKNSYDAFSSKRLLPILKRLNIDDLIITGVFGDGCVHSTIQGGFSAGYNLIILKDLIETTDVPIRQELQGLLKRYTWPVMFGKTITSEEFVAGVRKRKG